MLNLSQLQHLTQKVSDILTKHGVKYINFPQNQSQEQCYLRLYEWLISSEQTYIDILEHKQIGHDDLYAFVFQIDNTLYKMEYGLNSWSSNIEISRTKIYNVKKTVETIITYQKEPDISDMKYINASFYGDEIVDINVIDAIYDTTEKLIKLSCGLKVKEQMITNLHTHKVQIGGILIFLENQWLYFSESSKEFFNIF